VLADVLHDAGSGIAFNKFSLATIVDILNAIPAQTEISSFVGRRVLLRAGAACHRPGSWHRDT
jgi:hypothetical protein